MYGVSIKEKETFGLGEEYIKYLRISELKRLVVDRVWAQSSEVLQNFCFITKSTLFLCSFIYCWWEHIMLANQPHFSGDGI